MYFHTGFLFQSVDLNDESTPADLRPSAGMHQGSIGSALSTPTQWLCLLPVSGEVRTASLQKYLPQLSCSTLCSFPEVFWVWNLCNVGDVSEAVQGAVLHFFPQITWRIQSWKMDVVSHSKLALWVQNGLHSYISSHFREHWFVLACQEDNQRKDFTF